MTSKLRILLLAAGLLSLPACGPLAEDGPVPTAISTLLQGREEVAPVADPRRDLTREMIDASPTPLLLVVIAEQDVAASLFQVGEAGSRTSWLTTDGIGITLRGGMLAETRGLGEDLMAADLSNLRLDPATAIQGRRIHDYLDGTDKITRSALACEVAPVGQQDVQVVGRSYKTTLVEETCSSEQGQFVNRYWIEAGGLIRKSRQWVSPNVGYLEISRL